MRKNYTAEEAALAELLHNIICNHPRLRSEDFARALGCSKTHMHNALNTNDNTNITAVPRLGWLFTIVARSGDFGPLDYLESLLGRVAIPVPDEGDMPVERMKDVLVRLGKEDGDIYKKFLEATGADSPGGAFITKEEREEMIKEVLEAIQVLSLFLQMLKPKAEG